MNSNSFDPDAVHALVDAALAKEMAATQTAEGELHHPVELPFSLLNMGWFGMLDQILAEHHVAPVIRAGVLDDLRHRVVADVERASPVAFYGQVTRCRKCQTVEGTPCLPHGARPSPDLLVVHELPVRNGVLSQRLIDTLADAGFAPDRVMHTSAIRCDPATVRGASPEELEACQSFLLAEIQMVTPKLVLLLGAAPFASVFGKDLRITTERGKLLWLGPWAFLPTFSLGYLLRRGETDDATFDQDIRTAHQYLYGEA